MNRVYLYFAMIGLSSVMPACRMKQTSSEELATGSTQSAVVGDLDPTIGSPILGGSNPGSGIVDVTLEVKKVPNYDYSGVAMDYALTYNGVVPGPTIVANVGDELVLTVKNASEFPTILHPHGFTLPPQYDGTHLSQKPIRTGGQFTHRFKLLHAGTYWYHSHHDAVQQMGRGLYGSIVVRGKNEPKMPEKVLVISNVNVVETKNEDGNVIKKEAKVLNVRDLIEKHTYLINGKMSRTTTIRPGESQRLRIINATVEHVVDLRLSNGQPLVQISTDGGLTDRPYPMNHIALDAGERADVVITAPADSKDPIVLIADPIPLIPKVPNRNSANDPTAVLWAQIKQEYNPKQATNLLKFDIQGEPTEPLVLPQKLDDIPQPPISSSTVVRNFRVRFAPYLDKNDKKNPMVALFPITYLEDPNSLPTKENPTHGFYPNTPTPVERLGTWVVHRWQNNSPVRHPVHVHGYRFIVLKRNGVDVPVRGWKDTADLPAYGDLEYAINLEGYPGKWLYHCHFEGHMEHGFMGEMIVNDPDGKSMGMSGK